MAVPQRLREIRLDQVLNQRDLAIKTDVTQTTILEVGAGGDVRPSTQRKLDEALGVTPRELVGSERSA